MIVSILGCGWLGIPLAKELISKGFLVKGSTTTENKIDELKNTGIIPYLVNIPSGPDEDYQDFFDCDTLIFSIPPKRNSKNVEDSFSKISKSALALILKSKIKNLLFISSTSVYPANNKTVKESDANPDKTSGKALLKAENLFSSQNNLNTTIVRFAGLIGYDRNALRLLKRRQKIDNAGTPVNLIHRDDCIEILWKIIDADKWGYVFNACADEHPLRTDFYLDACKIVLKEKKRSGQAE